MTKIFKIAGIILGLVLLFVCAMAMRRMVLEAQFRSQGSELPFSMESALEFRLVRMLAETGRLPDWDFNIQTPQGVSTRATYTVGAEYLYAAVAKVLPSGMTLESKVRWIALGWFCLGIPVLALWVGGWSRSVWGAAVAGGYYAVSMASVIRSTGQELSHENYALPWLIAWLGLQAWARRQPARGFRKGTVVSAGCLGMALMGWDLVQYMVLLWAVWFSVLAIRGTLLSDDRLRFEWGVTSLMLLAVGVLNPYLRAHAFWGSSAMLLSYGSAAALLAEKTGVAWVMRQFALWREPRCATPLTLKSSGPTGPAVPG
ncbi:MAG: hypothetical protein HY343_07775, partial [Lentisphaerae bacterium]|nr:hypothetical protein [Lentisphaerota bacterium]